MGTITPQNTLDECQTLSGPERRRRARLRCATEGWVLPGHAEAGAAAEPWEVLVRDVSRLGVAFESFEELKRGEIRRIRIGRGPLHLARAMRVVRCRPGQGGSYTIGGEFI